MALYVGKFNWTYSDGYEELALIQQSGAFSCNLLQTFGNQFRQGSFDVERFLGFLGLAEYTWEQKPKGVVIATIARTPLLMDAFRLQVR